jgi:O-antigen/teichoic acid export membrane protein
VAGTAAFCLITAATRFPTLRARPRQPLRETLGYLREAAPIGLSELTWAFLWYAATVLLGLMVTGPSLGWFGAAHRAIMALHTFVWLYFFNLLPSISRCIREPGETLVSILNGSLNLTSWGGIFVALTFSLFAKDLLRLTYGQTFARGEDLLATLVWIIPVALLSGHWRYTLIAYDFQTVLFRCTAASAGVVILLCLILIPEIGALGAVYGLLAGCVLEAILTYVFVCRLVVRVEFLPRLIAPAGALAAALTCYWPGGPLAAWFVFLCSMLFALRREIRRLPLLLFR